MGANWLSQLQVLFKSKRVLAATLTLVGFSLLSITVAVSARMQHAADVQSLEHKLHHSNAHWRSRQEKITALEQEIETMKDHERRTVLLLNNNAKLKHSAEVHQIEDAAKVAAHRIAAKMNRVASQQWMPDGLVSPVLATKYAVAFSNQITVNASALPQFVRSKAQMLTLETMRRRLPAGSPMQLLQGEKALVVVHTEVDLPEFDLVIRHNIRQLGNSWRLVIFHGVDNEKIVKKTFAEFGNTEFINTGAHWLDDSGYNTILKSEWFWVNLIHRGVHKALISQVDSVLLNSEVHKFMQWDYIGAPWATDSVHYQMPSASSEWDEATVAIAPLPKELRVGSGGLSLRTSLAMLHTLMAFSEETTPAEPEDVFFVRNLGKLDYALADLHSATEFALEVPTEAFSAETKLFAVHGVWQHLARMAHGVDDISDCKRSDGAWCGQYHQLNTRLQEMLNAPYPEVVQSATTCSIVPLSLLLLLLATCVLYEGILKRTRVGQLALIQIKARSRQLREQLYAQMVASKP